MGKLNTLEELLPDFNDMTAVASASNTARLQLHRAKQELDTFIAECVRQAYTNNLYWVNGKPPTQTYIDRVVSVVGNTAEDAQNIQRLSQAISELQKDVDEGRATLTTMRDQVNVFQTLSANKRAGIT